jgi:hypothetical protein
MYVSLYVHTSSLYANFQSYKKGDGDMENTSAKSSLVHKVSRSKHVRAVLGKKRKEHRYPKVKPSENHRARWLSN